MEQAWGVKRGIRNKLGMSTAKMDVGQAPGFPEDVYWAYCVGSGVSGSKKGPGLGVFRGYGRF